LKVSLNEGRTAIAIGKLQRVPLHKVWKMKKVILHLGYKKMILMFLIKYKKDDQ